MLELKNEKRVAINLKSMNKLPEIRNVGVKESKIREPEYNPSKKIDETDFLKQFSMTPPKKVDPKNQNKPDKEKEVDEARSDKQAKIQKTLDQINFTQRQVLTEVRKERRIENPILNNMDYMMKFDPPKGVSLDELNDIEKIFYSFYKRVATQYINSIQSTYLSKSSDKPYLENKVYNHKPIVMSAMIRYDSEGNAEVIKILKSSDDDDVHQMFEEALKKMNKIPNIAKELKDEDGKYTAYFQLSLNNKK